MVYRSGALHKLTSVDVTNLESLPLKTIIDFRSEREFIQNPAVPIKTVVQYERLPIRDSARETAILYLEKRDEEGLRNLLVHEYSRMVRRDQEMFHNFFRILATAEKLPLVFHCTAGKDRTGLASALFLSALGAGADTMWYDYMATNHYLGGEADRIIQELNGKGIPGDMIRPLLEVRPSYLQAALDVIQSEFGGLTVFIRDVLQADLDAIRGKFLMQE